MVDFRESDFNLLLNALHEGVCYLNAQGEVLHFNQAAQSHWHSNQLHSKKFSTQPPVARALAGEYIYHDTVHVYDDQTLLVSAVPLFDAANAVTAVMLISQDISEHILLEQEARTALDIFTTATLETTQLDDVDEVLRRLAALVSELKAVDTSFAFRLDEAKRKLIPVALFGANQQHVADWQSELSAIELNTERAIQQPAYLQAIRLARTFMIDFTVDTKHDNPRNLRAAIYAPVLLHGKVFGLLGAERHRPLSKANAYFPAWSDALLTAMARLASMSLEKAALLTSVEHLETEAESLRKQLNQKEEFLLLTSHELKNPLTAILGQAQVMQRSVKRLLKTPESFPQTSHELINGLRSIEHQTRRIEHMINTLLDVSRLDLNRLELYLEDIDLFHLVRRTLNEQIPTTASHELRLFVQGEPVAISDDDQPPSVSPIIIQGDEKRLEQIVTNLLSNAIKYSPSGSPITVSLHTTGDHVELSVEDRGIGIPPHEQGRLTERFYRAENARTSNAQGLGIGLYLAHSLVIKHGGRISVFSEGIPGKGSTFTVQLPAQQA